MPKSLVIVESPAKAKTLSRFLGRDYQVEASLGHVRDLPESADEVPAEIRDKPWANLGVDIDGDFKPYYVVPASKRRQVAHLRAAVKDASAILLATDPDREGESISYHLVDLLKPRIRPRRVTFHEITREAVQQAIREAHDIDENLVRAQESRRILDRLFGYTLSPVLWKKVRTGLSAGRVQSVAVRLIVEREEARGAFRPATYWDIEARLAAEGREFPAVLVRIGADRVAVGRDFDSTGTLVGSRVRHVDERLAKAVADAVRANLPWRVTAVEVKPGTERPAPPFTTSTLTQEASRKLGFSTARTMRIAQRLKDGVDLADGSIEGIITYHRTDSTTLSEKALAESGRVIREMFGGEYYQGPRRYQTQVRNAQEAHEAIRPTDFTVTPQSLIGVLDADELRLYELIWKRTMASQMPDARVLKTTVEFTAAGPGGEPCAFTAAGKAIEFAGYRRAYVEGSDDPDSELEAQETILPAFNEGDLVVAPGTSLPAEPRAKAALAGLEPKRHDTVPPPRFTEASLIKKLEEEGIGRPSTYEPTIETILRRGYVFRQGKALVPSFTAFAVTRLLRDHFADFVDIGFTAEMEKDLDEISNGERGWVDFIREFFRGDGKQHKGLEPLVNQGAQTIDYPVIEIGGDPATGQPIRVRIGKFGPFLQVGEGGPGNTASLPEDLAPADLTVEKAVSLVHAKAAGPRELGTDPATGLKVYVANGRFGPYVQLGETPEKPAKGAKAAKPKRASLPRGLNEAEADLATALRLLSLPRELGRHPESGETVVASVGRFGPYVKHGDEFRSLAPDDDVYSIGLDRALALLAEPKQPRRRQAAAKTVLRELGDRADTGAPVKLFEGRYGPYVSDGKTNASLPKGTDPAQVGLHEAVQLLEARAAAGPKKGARGRAPATTSSRTAGAARTRKKKEPVGIG